MLLLVGDMNFIFPASFINKKIQLRDKIRTSGISSLFLIHRFLTPLPTLPSVPVIAKYSLQRRFKIKHVIIISRTEMLVLMATDEGWTTSGAAVGEAEVEITVESLTRPQIWGNLTLVSWFSCNSATHRVPPLLLWNTCLGGFWFGRERKHVPCPQRLTEL